MPKMFLLIKADTNDADYIYSKEEITPEEVDQIRPMVEAIKNFKPYTTNIDGHNWTHDHNFPIDDCLREDLGEISAEELYKNIPGFEIFSDLIPHTEYGIHTIESIETVYEGEKLFSRR